MSSAADLKLLLGEIGSTLAFEADALGEASGVAEVHNRSGRAAEVLDVP